MVGGSLTALGTETRKVETLPELGDRFRQIAGKFVLDLHAGNRDGMLALAHAGLLGLVALLLRRHILNTDSYGRGVQPEILTDPVQHGF